MTSKGTAGLGILAAAALIVFAVVNPGKPVTQTRPNNAYSLASTAIKVANGAALGGGIGGTPAATAAVPLPNITPEQLQALIDQKIKEAGANAQAEIQKLLPQYAAGATSQVKAELNRLAAKYLGPQAQTQLTAPKIPSGIDLMDSNKLRAQANQYANQLANYLGGAAMGAVSGGASGSAGSGNGGQASASGGVPDNLGTP